MTPSQIREANITRSKALVYGLSGHLGCLGESHQFAKAYDEATRSDTAADKRWLRCMQGKVALTPKAVEKLAAAFPDYPVQRMYRDGPSGLWQALWGELDELRNGVLADDFARALAYDMANVDDTASLGDFNRALCAFETSVLRAVAAGDQPILNVSHLARAVAFRRVLSLFRLETYGMDLIISMCMENFFIYAELVGFDAQEEVSDQIGLAIRDPKPVELAGRIEALTWNKVLGSDECHWLMTQHQAVDTRTAWNWRNRRFELSLSLS